MNKKILIAGAIFLGIIFLVLACMYWSLPAGLLPHLIPGYEAGSQQIHFKHGVGAFILAVALFAYVWFASGSKNK